MIFLTTSLQQKMLQSKLKVLQTYTGDTFLSLEPAVVVGSKAPLFGTILVSLLDYVENFRSLG